MNRTAARWVRIALAAAILGFGADMGAAAAKAIIAKHGAEQTTTQTYILAIDSEAAAKKNCHEVVVETDEGYGVRGKITRTVCGKAA